MSFVISHYTTSKKTEKFFIPTKSTSMISLKDIDKVSRTDTVETLALNKSNLEVEKGEFLAIMGPSGCGKSSLLNVMGLLDTPTKGSISIDKETTAKLSDKQLAAFR